MHLPVAILADHYGSISTRIGIGSIIHEECVCSACPIRLAGKRIENRVLAVRTRIRQHADGREAAGFKVIIVNGTAGASVDACNTQPRRRNCFGVIIEIG